MTNDQHTDEFDAFLKTAVEESDTQTERAIIDLESTIIIHDALARHGVTTIIDDDDTRADEKLARFVEYRLDYLRTMMWPQFEADGVTEESFEEYINRQIQAEVADEMVRQYAIVGAVTTILGTLSDAQAVASSPNLVEELAIQKKQLLSTLLVEGLVLRDDGWYAMVNEVLPGAVFDPEGVEDMPYMLEAMRDQQTQLEKQPAYDKLVEELEAVLGAFEAENGEIELFASMSTELMVCIDAQLTRTESDTAARIDEILRKYGIFGQAVDEIQRITLRFRILDTY